MRTLVSNKCGFEIQAKAVKDMSTSTVDVIVEITDPNHKAISCIQLKRSQVVNYDKSTKPRNFVGFVLDSIAGFTKDEMNQAWNEMFEMVSSKELMKANLEIILPHRTPIEELIDEVEARIRIEKSIQVEASICEGNSNIATSDEDLFDDNF
jgi:hypothetical protein